MYEKRQKRRLLCAHIIMKQENTAKFIKPHKTITTTRHIVMNVHILIEIALITNNLKKYIMVIHRRLTTIDFWNVCILKRV